MSRKNRPNKRPKLANEGALGRLGYFFGRALLNIRQNVFISIVTVGTIAVALLIISLFLLVFVNLEGVATDWSRKVQVTVYFDKEPIPAEMSALKARIQGLPGTDRITFVDKEDAMRRFRDRLKGQEALLEGIPADVLPASFEISLKGDWRRSDAVEAYVGRLKKIPGVGEVQYGEEWVRRYTTFMAFMRMVGLLLGGFLFLSAMFIVSNTIKLTIYSRKEELEILGLVGATRLFIKAPFLIEGVIQGVGGGAIALVVLAGFYFGFLHNAGNFLTFNPADVGLVFLPFPYLCAILGGGILLGFLGSLTSLKRFVTI